MNGTMRTTKRTFISAALAGAIAVMIFTGSTTQPAHAQATGGIPPAVETGMVKLADSNIQYFSRGKGEASCYCQVEP
jgi:hypothetical protein